MNNCEHFCESCLRGTTRDLQVDARMARPRLMLLATLRLIIPVPEVIKLNVGGNCNIQ
jgi:hypothetical protein